MKRLVEPVKNPAPIDYMAERKLSHSVPRILTMNDGNLLDLSYLYVGGRLKRILVFSP